MQSCVTDEMRRLVLWSGDVVRLSRPRRGASPLFGEWRRADVARHPDELLPLEHAGHVDHDDMAMRSEAGIGGQLARANLELQTLL